MTYLAWNLGALDMNTMNWRNRKNLPDNSGFSLVEMMVVVLLIGILAGVTGPPMFQYLATNQMQTSTDRLVSDMLYARAVAVSTGETHRFSCDKDNYSIFNMSNGNVVRQVSFGSKIELDMAQNADFYPWGMAQSSTFVLSQNTISKKIILLPTGMVEVEVQ